jgi:multidrug efflux pump subunit AcrA (membrane-fusion protein)
MTEEHENTEDWRVRAESAEAALSQMQAQMTARVAQAELKAEAVRAGMIDLDGLKLIDVASIRLNQNGEVEDAASLLARMKREKPWLFGAGVSSSAAANPPRPEPPRSRHANELSHEEWLSARAALIRRR